MDILLGYVSLLTHYFTLHYMLTFSDAAFIVMLCNEINHALIRRFSLNFSIIIIKEKKNRTVEETFCPV